MSPGAPFFQWLESQPSNPASGAEALNLINDCAQIGTEERQSSSGIIVSTGLGSTGRLKGVYAGWATATRCLLGRDVKAVGDGSFPWDAGHLHYFVREPYPSRTTQAGLVIGKIAEGQRMHVMSEMPENGVVFSDGIEADYLEFNSGTEATIAVAERQGLLVI